MTDTTTQERAVLVSRALSQHQGQRAAGRLLLLIFLMLPLLLAWCTPSGDSNGLAAPPTAPSPQAEQQAIENLLVLYRQALLHEDIDRVQALLQADATLAVVNEYPPNSLVRQADDGTFATLTAFRDMLTDTFRTQTLTALVLHDVALAADHGSVTFHEVESTLDPATLVQQTRVFRTTFHLARIAVGSGTGVRIAAVTRQGPWLVFLPDGGGPDREHAGRVPPPARVHGPLDPRSFDGPGVAGAAESSRTVRPWHAVSRQ